jgi:flagellar biosynthesis protein FliQ
MDSCGVLIVAFLAGLGIDMLLAWAVAAIWSLPFWPVLLTILLLGFFVGLLTAGSR